LDGDPATIWHSAQSPTDPFSQSLTIDLGRVADINMVTYLPRQDNENGVITAYNLYTSLDGKEFKRVASGNWEKNLTRKVAIFPTTKAAYIKLEATAGVGNFASAAEVNVYPSSHD